MGGRAPMAIPLATALLQTSSSLRSNLEELESNRLLLLIKYFGQFFRSQSKGLSILYYNVVGLNFSTLGQKPLHVTQERLFNTSIIHGSKNANNKSVEINRAGSPAEAEVHAGTPESRWITGTFPWPFVRGVTGAKQRCLFIRVS